MGIIRSQKSVWNMNDRPCSYLGPFICAEPGDYPTTSPTSTTSIPTATTSIPTEPTHIPSMVPTATPTTSPTTFPTTMPTEKLFEMKQINQMSCSNLIENSALQYDIGLTECMQ
eukprot:1106645_1